MARGRTPSGRPLLSTALPNQRSVDGVVTQTADQTPTAAPLQRTIEPDHKSAAAHANHWRGQQHALRAQREAMASAERPLA